MAYLIVISIIIWVVCLAANIRIARQKNRKYIALWVVLSVFFDVITLVVNAIAPKREDDSYDLKTYRHMRF